MNTERIPNPNKKTKHPLRGALAAGAGLLALTVGAHIVKDSSDRLNSGIEKDELTDEYNVKSGDTAWKIAEQRTPKEDDVRPLVDEILRQAENDGTPGLQPGDKIQVPPTTEPKE